MKLTLSYIESLVVSEQYAVVAERQSMICTMRLRNRTVIIGEAHYLDEGDFTLRAGQEAARADAIRQVWPLAAYAVRELAYLRTQAIEEGGLPVPGELAQRSAL